MKLTLWLILFAVVGLAQSPKAMSQDDFIKQVVFALSAKDEKALGQLAITKDEFKKYVWPSIAMAVSNSTTNMNADKFYAVYQNSSTLGLKKDLESFGESKWEVVSVAPGLIQKKSKDYTLFQAPE